MNPAPVNLFDAQEDINLLLSRLDREASEKISRWYVTAIIAGETELAAELLRFPYEFLGNEQAEVAA